MGETQASGLLIKQITSDTYAPQVRGFLEDRIARHRRVIEYQHESQEKFRPSGEERQIRSRLRDRLIDSLNARAEVEQLKELAAARHAEVLNRCLLNPGLDLYSGLHPLGGPFDLGDGSLEMWWAFTTFFYWLDANMWVEADGDHFAAKFETESGDLQKRGLKVVAHYVLGADRMPPGNRFYLSAPYAELVGTAFASAMGSGMYDFGDEWAKCWLNTKQTLFVLPEPGPGLIASIAIGQVNAESRRVVFIEGGGVEHVTMPGLFGMPPIRFFLPAGSASIIVELEWAIDVQLENDSFVFLGHSPEAPSCVLNHPQWPLRLA